MWRSHGQSATRDAKKSMQHDILQNVGFALRIHQRNIKANLREQSVRFTRDIFRSCPLDPLHLLAGDPLRRTRKVLRTLDLNENEIRPLTDDQINLARDAPPTVVLDLSAGDCIGTRDRVLGR